MCTGSTLSGERLDQREPHAVRFRTVRESILGDDAEMRWRVPTSFQTTSFRQCELSNK